MGTPARIVLVLGFALVLGLALDGWRAGRGLGRPARGMARGDGVLEGRVELAEDLIALRRSGCVPALLALVKLPCGPATAEVEENGRFYLSGLPLCALDLELCLGGEVLARVEGITPRAASAQLGSDALDDPRLSGIALAGPLRLLELDVVGLDGAGLDRGWLAWRASGEAQYARVVPILAGRATIATCAEVVDVLPLVTGCDAIELPCAVGGERLVVSPAGPIVASAPEVPEGIMLRLELVETQPWPGLVGEAFLRSCEVRGGWAAADGRAELYVVGSGPAIVQWGAYCRCLDRLTRARGARATAARVPAGGFSERRVVAPLDMSELPARDGDWSR